MRENALLHPRLGQPQVGEPQTGEQAPAARAAQPAPADAGLEKRYSLALVAYVLLAALVWFTMDSGKVLVLGRPVELRLIPLLFIGGFALRTVLAHQAERIRRGGEKE